MIVAPGNEPLRTGILAIMYGGDVVFAISGALTVFSGETAEQFTDANPFKFLGA
jgi:hypothetical protein